MKTTYYLARTIAAITPEFVSHKTIRIPKKDLTVHCTSCGAKRITVLENKYTAHDKKTGRVVTTSYYIYKCPNKRWYNFIGHWDGTEYKVVKVTQ